MRLFILFAIPLCLAFATLAEATQHRSAKAKAEFKRLHPCPAPGKPKGGCPGYVVDHIVPLCAGGADAPSNMQWQTIEDGKRKDKVEWAQCARKY